MIKIRSKTKEKDKGEKRFIEKLNQLKRGPHVKVGVLQNTGTHSGDLLTVAEVAAFNEYGTENIPERSFIRSAIQEHRAELIQITGQLYKQMSEGKLSTEDALGRLGLKIQSLIRNKIDSIEEPPNAERTIARKGSSKPLIDTGQMRQAINYEIVKEGKK
jgi:hypothetical protein